MNRFPPRVLFWGYDNMVTSWLITIVDRQTKERETTALTTIMKLRRGRPYTSSKDKRRMVDVRLIRWNAKGFSQMLGKTIEYRLSDGVEQPMSHVYGKSVDEDYPSSMVFNAVFDVVIDNKVVASRVAGTATAEGLHRIPPDGDDLFDVKKDIELDNPAVTIMSGGCMSRFAITAGQRFLVKLGLLFGVVPDYFRTYLQA